MPDTDRPTRWVELEGAHNTRDVAGLRAGRRRVRSGVLLRSDHLDNLTRADLTVLHDEVGLRAVVDLRTRREVPEPPAWVAAGGVARLHLPLIDLAWTRPDAGPRAADPDPTAVYRAMLEEAGPGISAIVSFVLAGERTPVVIHCAAGKDRTGIAIAVLLAAAGVDDAEIEADYLATGERLERIRLALSSNALYPTLGDPASARPMSPRGIRAVLQALADFDGGARGFLRSAGTSDDELDRWRDTVLEPG